MNTFDSFIQYKKDNSKFLNLQPGETFKGTFKGALQKRNRFNNDVLVYNFVSTDGVKKEWEEGSVVTAKKFRDIKPETVVELRCTASEKKNPNTGKPYREVAVWVDGKEVLLPSEPTDAEIPVVDEDDLGPIPF